MSQKYARSHVPDMLSTGHPNITAFRTSRARQVSYDPAERVTEPAVKRSRRFPSTRVLFSIAGMLIVLGLVIFWNQAVVPWWTTSVADQWKYGSNRITQVNENVGHGGMSSFLAEYYHHEIVVIEIDQDATYHIYTLNGVYDVSGTPVIQVSFVAGRVTGKPDMLVSVEGSNLGTTFYNTGSAFTESEP